MGCWLTAPAAVAHVYTFTCTALHTSTTGTWQVHKCTTCGLTYLRRTLQAVHVDDVCLLLQQAAAVQGLLAHTVVLTLYTRSAACSGCTRSAQLSFWHVCGVHFSEGLSPRVIHKSCRVYHI
jgi:hypothetical protein